MIGLVLAGVRVLVIEDDYYLAQDAAQSLRQAGAVVVGPCSDAAEAAMLVERDKPGCVLMDVNLGRGPNFAPARALRALGLSLIFLTGYDTEVIPEDLRDAPFLQKPISEARLVSAVLSVCKS